MRVTPRQYAQALFEAVHAVSDVNIQEQRVAACLRQAIKNGDGMRMGLIVDAYQALIRKQKGVQDIQCTSTRLHDGIQDLFGEEYRVTHKVDPSLIGGIQIRVGDDLIDRSVRTKLERLHQSLTQI